MDHNMRTYIIAVGSSHLLYPVATQRFINQTPKLASRCSQTNRNFQIQSDELNRKNLKRNYQNRSRFNKNLIDK